MLCDFHCWMFGLVQWWYTILFIYSIVILFSVACNTCRHSTTNRDGCFMRHPLPWAWLANILPGDRWRPLRRWDPAWNRSGTCSPSTKCRQQTCQFFDTSSSYASNEKTVFLFYTKDHIDWKLQAVCLYTCFFTTGCEVNHGRHGHGQKVSKHHNLHGGRWSMYLGDDFARWEFMGVRWPGI